MFTGIIEKIGQVKQIRNVKNVKEFRIASSSWRDSLQIGESIAVDGVCLTAKRAGKNWFLVDAVSETLKATTLGDLKPGNKINLERSLQWGKRIGGHYVTGHVDCTSRILEKKKKGKAYLLKIALPRLITPYLISKGSVAIDGISFTIQRRLPKSFEVAVIPYTAQKAVIGLKKAGDRVNLEADMTVKIILKSSKRKQNRPKHK